MKDRLVTFGVTSAIVIEELSRASAGSDPNKLEEEQRALKASKDSAIVTNIATRENPPKDQNYIYIDWEQNPEQQEQQIKPYATVPLHEITNPKIINLLKENGLQMPLEQVLPEASEQEDQELFDYLDQADLVVDFMVQNPQAIGQQISERDVDVHLNYAKIPITDEKGEITGYKEVVYPVYRATTEKIAPIGSLIVPKLNQQGLPEDFLILEDPDGASDQTFTTIVPSAVAETGIPVRFLKVDLKQRGEKLYPISYLTAEGEEQPFFKDITSIDLNKRNSSGEDIGYVPAGESIVILSDTPEPLPGMEPYLFYPVQLSNDEYAYIWENGIQNGQDGLEAQDSPALYFANEVNKVARDFSGKYQKPDQDYNIKLASYENQTIILEEEVETESAFNVQEAAYNQLPDNLKTEADTGLITFDTKLEGYTRHNEQNNDTEIWRNKIGWLAVSDVYTMEDGTTFTLELNRQEMLNRQEGYGYSNIIFSEEFKKNIIPFLEKVTPNLRGKIVSFQLVPNFDQKLVTEYVSWNNTRALSIQHDILGSSLKSVRLNGVAAQIFFPEAGYKADEVVISDLLYSGLIASSNGITGRNIFRRLSKSESPETLEIIRPIHFPNVAYGQGTKLVDINPQN